MSQKRGFGTSPVVPLTSDIHKHLRDNHAGQTGGVKLLDGVYYTANKDDSYDWELDVDTTWEKNPVYTYNGERYVRVTPYAYQNNATHKYNNTTANPENIGQVYVAAGSASNYRWFKVEPIKWIILNPINNIIREDKDNAGLGFPTDLDVITVPQGTTLELYAADVLMSGIPYDINSGNTWNSERTMYKYLNTEFYSQAFSTAEANMIRVSTIYNNTEMSDYNSAVNGLNSNHLTTGGLNPTTQKIYLLSLYELANAASPYVVEGNKIFDSGEGSLPKRQASGTDYARAHYLYLYNGNSHYWTRTAYKYFSSFTAYCVNYSGYMDYSIETTSAYNGQRPALQLKCDCFVEPLLSGGVSRLGMYPISST